MIRDLYRSVTEDGGQPRRRLAAAFSLAAAMLCGAPAHADWRQDIGTFRIGVVAEPGGGDTVQGLATIEDAYTKALGMPVDVVVAESYEALIEAQMASRVHYAVYSATAYAAASLRCDCVEPLAAPSGEDGSAGIRSVLVSHDGRLKSLEDMAKGRIALGPADNIAARLLPLAALAGEGVVLTGSEPFFIAAATPSETESLLADGSVDALFGWQPSSGEGGTLARLETAGLDRARLTVVWRSGILRYGPHAVRKDLNSEARRRLLAFLTTLKDRPDIYDLIEPHRPGGFRPVSAEDYALAFAIARFAAATPADPTP